MTLATRSAGAGAGPGGGRRCSRFPLFRPNAASARPVGRVAAYLLALPLYPIAAAQEVLTYALWRVALAPLDLLEQLRRGG